MERVRYVRHGGWLPTPARVPGHGEPRGLHAPAPERHADRRVLCEARWTIVIYRLTKDYSK